MKTKVYLSGGMRSGWQDFIKENVDLIFYDPRDKETGRQIQPNEYVDYDLLKIKQSDIIFVYFEKDNQSGIGLSAEIGYARALDKTIILCIQPGHEKDKYFNFLRGMCNYCYSDLNQAIEYLKIYEK